MRGRPWQKGYDIEFLKDIEKTYISYNEFSLSPFSKMSKNKVAEYLHNRTLKQLSYCQEPTFIKIDEVKSRTKIHAYHNIEIGIKEKGDIVFSFLIGDHEGLHDFLNEYMKRNCWLYIWNEASRWKQFAKDNGFQYVFGKVTTFGEIYGIYFRDAADNALMEERRIHPIIDPVEKINIKKIGPAPKVYLNMIKNNLDKLGLAFQNHYSNYNMKKSWSALSLRGYSTDPLFIEKPSEMNDKWWKGRVPEQFRMQDTPLMNDFPWVYRMLEICFGKDIEYHRIRFMKLKPGGGELNRHTDLVDEDCGNNIGRLARFHFPIITNDKVTFQSWNYDGNRSDVNMKVGEWWLLDTRKPHRVVNGGETERVHLVIDAVVTEKIYQYILR